MDQGMNNVMIAIDEGQCSNFAVEWALSNLKPIFNSGAGILLFTAVSTNYSSIVGGTHGAANLDLIAHIQENQEKTAIALLDKAKDLCVKHGVHVETAYEFGDPKDEICEAVEIYEVQLLVLGSHDIGAIQSCEEDMERERKKVMVAIDESKESYYTLLWAIDNIHEILASHQLVIFAAEPLPNYNNLFAASLSSAPLYSTVISAQDFAKSVQEIEKKVAIGLLEKAKSVCNSRG